MTLRLSSLVRLVAAAVILPSAAVGSLPGHAQSDLAAAGYPVPVNNSIGTAINEWKSLQQPGVFPFPAYADFLRNNSGWPGETAMRKTAELSIRSTGEAPDQVVTFFRQYPPLTPIGHLRHAEALENSGSTDDARRAARLAWTGGIVSPSEESLLMTRFASSLSAADHDQRMEHLLWSRATTAALRQLPFTSAIRRPLFEARLAMLTRSADAALKKAAVERQASNDAGFLIDTAFWFRNTGNLARARETLGTPLPQMTPPVDPAKWLDSLYDTAKNAANDSQWETVWNVARQAQNTYPNGTVIRDRPFGERDDYTSLTWLGGMTSLTKRGRPTDALLMFDLYANAARSPQTKAKGLYWAGRAAEAAGNRDQATSYYERAMQFYDQFHGQLACERLGRPLLVPKTRRTLELSAAMRTAFENRSVIRAAAYLGATGQRQEQTKFIRAIAASAVSETDHYLASELAVKLNRPDLNVLIGRSAREDGFDDYVSVSFPQMQIPGEHAGSWTMIHAITRQESQFDRTAMSPVGARGLMQLMPGTARETAAAAGVAYSLATLTEDPQANIRLGSTYFSQLMDRFSGSYVLSVAAYNAGPGNVNKWLRANGDPRVPGTDVLAWIEAIPLSETRGYVQRVLENAVVYDMLNASRANVRSKTPLSAYLGKSQPG